MNEDYARSCAVPRAFTIAGRPFRVRKVCPRDLADIQAWFKDELIDPRISARDRIKADPEMSDDEARRIWTDAAVGLEWPPELGSTLGIAMMGRPEGMARFLYAVCHRDEPELTLDLCRATASVMTVQDYTRLWEIASPMEIGDVVDPDVPEGRMGYEEIRAGLCEKYGWPLEYVDDLPFELIKSAWADGKRQKGLAVTCIEDANEVYRTWRRYVHGLQ